jgi:hypothetical protein
VKKNETQAHARIAELVLAWLASQQDGKGTRARLDTAIEGLVGHLPGWRAEVDGAVGALVEEDSIARAGQSLHLTARGRGRVLAALGVGALPAEIGWRSMKRDYLLPRMISLPRARPKRGKPTDDLRAGVLAHCERLASADGAPTLAAVGNALVWKALGADSARPLTKKALLAHVLGDALGGARARTPEQALALLAAKHVGARRPDANELSAAIVRGWLDGRALPVPEEAPNDAATPPPPGPPQRNDEDLAAFAHRVLGAARAAKDGRFGDNKVFISHVHRSLGVPGLDLEAFKKRLVEAQRAGLVDLSRADLVEAMSPEDVRASETHYLDATFHFVRL